MDTLRYGHQAHVAAETTGNHPLVFNAILNFNGPDRCRPATR